MKILVTGATGFVGSYVVRELLNSNIEVIATSRSVEKAELQPWFPEVNYVPCDLNDIRKDYYSFFDRPDRAIHLSWEGLPNYMALFHIENNLYANYLFLKNLIENGLRHLVVTGTCFEYGIRNGLLDEESESRPNNPYGLAKDTLRKFLVQLQWKKYFILQWVRLFYLYGEGQNPSSILSQLDTAIENNEKEFKMSEGDQLRDYLSVQRVAEYIVKIALQKDVVGTINCCSGTPISIRKLVENHLREKQKNIALNLGYYPYPEHEPMAFWGDNKKLLSILEQS